MGHPLLELKDKTAVVIGGTSGIGLALTKALAQAGANVVPTGRRAQLVSSAASVVEHLGGRSLAVPCDVTDIASLDNLLRLVCDAFGSVEILVNCAGRTKRAPTLEFTDADWGAIMETNLTGTLRSCRVFGRHMIERRYGRIINIGSLSSSSASRGRRLLRQQRSRGFAHQVSRSSGRSSCLRECDCARCFSN
jgi:NAD(P)-dependent dehydrogenase (short-subunit alcohol dehydrogenase family)